MWTPEFLLCQQLSTHSIMWALKHFDFHQISTHSIMWTRKLLHSNKISTHSLMWTPDFLHCHQMSRHLLMWAPQLHRWHGMLKSSDFLRVICIWEFWVHILDQCLAILEFLISLLNWKNVSGLYINYITNASLVPYLLFYYVMVYDLGIWSSLMFRALVKNTFYNIIYLCKTLSHGCFLRNFLDLLCILYLLPISNFWV